MAKKSKKFDAEGTTTTTEAPTSEVATPLIPRNPSLYLQNAAGVQYKFDRRDLPKKAAVMGQIKIDGNATPFQVTSNKGWTVEGKVLEYLWFTLPVKEGEEPVHGYITADYMQAATEFQDMEFTIGAGVANRKNPDRIPKSEEAEATRKAAAAATLAKKKAEAEAAKTEQVDAELTAG